VTARGTAGLAALVEQEERLVEPARGGLARNGVAIDDLSAEQRAKLRALLKTVLSSKGYSDEEAVRKADEYVGQTRASDYGEGLYYVAFYGTPSRSKKWTLQFGGHHLRST
jgi:hypothetical protein